MTDYRPNRGIGIVTKNLIIINVIFFFLKEIGEQMYGISVTELLGLNYFKSSNFYTFQFITYMFMHANFMHILSNMFGLFIFGRVLEQFWGPKRFLTYYLVCGLGAGLVQELVWHFQIPNTVDATLIYNQFITIGASGAVFGILLAFGMLFPNTELIMLFFPIPIKAKYFVVIYAVFELFSGVANFAGDNIAHFAHLGGMLFGFILIKYWQSKRDNFF